MADPSRGYRAGDPGLIDHLRSLAASLSSYLQGRLSLAGIEGKEAFVHFLKLLAWVILGGVALVFGYFFLCLVIVFALAQFSGISWIWITLGMALLHFAATAFCLWTARKRLAVPVFTYTMTEFRKDKEWLHSPPAIKNAS
jgi:uncharacterized membrane protein YqjE